MCFCVSFIMSLSLLSLFLVFPVAESLAGLANPNGQEVTEHIRRFDSEMATLAEAMRALEAGKNNFISMTLNGIDCTFKVSE